MSSLNHNLAALARAQERANLSEEDNDYGVSEEDDRDHEGDNRVRDEEQVERNVRKMLGETGRYRPCVPERWESEDGEGDDVEQTPNGSPVRG